MKQYIKLPVFEKPSVIEVPDDSEGEYRIMSEAVDGYIEVVKADFGCNMIVNEEGLLRNLPFNPIATMIAEQYIVGPAVLVGPLAEEDFESVPDEAMAEVLSLGI